jgi:energy-coupling factor transporter ATP-binding protein EcfA2
MRLLFIYFYKDFGTFEKGSIIHLSKKYKFTLDKEKSTPNEFYFNKEENPNLIEDFYSKNIDIGVLIGENGTGKSVLLNSIRDINNEYSISVYEEKSQFFSITNQKQIFIENQKITKEELNYIYYTSLIDAFDNDINDKYNISNRALLRKHDDLPLSNRLSLIENDDIHKYINFSKNSKLDYVKIDKLKLYCSETYFDEIKEKLIFEYKEELFKFLIQDINLTKNDKVIKEIVYHLKRDEIEDLYFEIIYDDNFLYTFRNKDILLEKQYEAIFKTIRKNFSKYENYGILINEFIENIQEHDFFKKLENLLSDFLENLLFIRKYDILTLKNSEENIFDDLNMYINNSLNRVDLEKLLFNFIQRSSNKNFARDVLAEDFEFFIYLIIDKLKDNILQKLLINFKQDIFSIGYKKREITNEEKKFKNIINKNFLFYLINYQKEKEDSQYRNLIFLVDLRIMREFVIEAVRNKLFKSQYLVNNFKIDLNKDIFLSNYLEIFTKDIINICEDVNIVKLLFNLSFHKYTHQFSSNQKLKLQTVLNILMFLDNPINKFKESKKFDELNIIKELDAHFNIFTRVSNILEEHIEEENGEVITELKDNFFDTYKFIIENFIKPFTYELYPSLSSGQKAILFIFARINDAIQKINQENPDENILILLDEADLKLHLEWQRKFVFDLVEFLNSYPNNKFYVLYATHSPMILSDITNDRVVFLKKKDDNPSFSKDKQDFTKSTFGANIYDIYADSFFVNNFMGEFAQNKINDVIKIIDEYKEKKEKNPDEFMPNEKALDNLKIVKSIGEPLLRNKLEDEIKSLVKDDIMEIVNNLKNKNHEEIEKELEKYSQFTQTKVLMKLLEIRK